MKKIKEDLNTAKSIIADQIRGEWEAIQNYNKAIDDLDEAGDFQPVMDLLNDIADEEETHVGELQNALSKLDDNVNINIENGQKEAEEAQMSSDDVVTEDVEEPLEEKIGSTSIDEIDKYINDLYELRKYGLATGGEYSLGNLIFKEARNKGYLDNLKELKNQLIGKALSLESLNENFENEIINYKGFNIEHFPYSYEYDGKTGEVDSWIIQSPYYIKSSESKDKMFLPLRPEDENGEELNFNTLDAAKAYIDKYIIPKKGKIKIKYGDEVHFELDAELLEDTKKIKDHKWVNKGKAGTHGTFTTKKDADAQRRAMFANGYHEDLEKPLSELNIRKYKDELSRISFNQAIVQNNGLFSIYNVKEDDVDNIVRQIRNLDYVDWVNKVAGRFDFSKVVMFGQPQKRYYTINGQIK